MAEGKPNNETFTSARGQKKQNNHLTKRAERHCPALVPDHNERSSRRTIIRSYHASLAKRVLPTKCDPTKVKAVETAVKTRMSRDFLLVAGDDTSIQCHRVVFENMCTMFDISPRWDPMTRIQLPAAPAIVERIWNFMYSGSIEIDETTVEILIGMADFLGFDSLMDLCTKFVGSFCRNTKLLLNLHDMYTHVPGLTLAFFREFSHLPLETDMNTKIRALKSMSVRQFKILMSCDDLQVCTEDEAVDFIFEWIQATEPTPTEIADCLKSIRKPFLTKRAADRLKAIFTSGLNLPGFLPDDFDRTKNCTPRNSYDQHIHILWKEHFDNRRGPTGLSVTCVSWNAKNELVEELTLFRCRESDFVTDDVSCGHYISSEGAVLRLAYDRYLAKIHVSQLDFERRLCENKHALCFSQLGSMHSPDFLPLTNAKTVSFASFDNRTRESKVVSIDTDTWTETVRNDGLMGKLPRKPRDLKLYDDCAIAITCRSVCISDANCREAKEIPMPPVAGFLVDFERIGNSLFVLEDLRQNYVSTPENYDRVHHIDLKKRQYRNFSKVPIVEEDPLKQHYDRTVESTKKFLKIHSDLYIVIQHNSDQPLNIFQFDFRRRRCFPVVSLEAPVPDYEDQDSAHTRAYMGIIPSNLCPCTRTQLRDTI